MEIENHYSTEQLIAAIRRDCKRQAEAANTRFSEVVECLRDGNHLGALGAFANLDEDMRTLKVFLVRMARLAGRAG